MKNVMLVTILLFSGVSMAAEVCKNKISGVYSNFTNHEETGDLLGIEITISKSDIKYYAVFQSAEGAARMPAVSEVKIDGCKINFAVNEASGYKGTFQGEVLNKKIKGKFLEGFSDPFGSKVFNIPRTNSYWTRPSQ